MRFIFTLVFVMSFAAAAETLICQSQQAVPGFEKNAVIKPTDTFRLTFDRATARFGHKSYLYLGESPGLDDKPVFSFMGDDPDIAFDYMQVEPVKAASQPITNRVMIFNVQSKPIWFQCQKQVVERLSTLQN